MVIEAGAGDHWRAMSIWPDALGRLPYLVNRGYIHMCSLKAVLKQPFRFESTHLVGY